MWNIFRGLGACSEPAASLDSELVTPQLKFLALTPLALLAGCHHSDFPDYAAGYREFAYVANNAGNTVSVLDLVYMRPDRTLQVGDAPVAMAVNPRRDEVYVVNSQPGRGEGSVSVIDTQKNAVVATIAVHHNPSFISVDATGHLAYVSNTGSNSISVLDLDSRRQITTVRAPDKPAEAVVSPDGRALAVTSRVNGTLTVYAADPLGTLNLRGTFKGCPGATGAVILPDSSKVFVACSAGRQVMVVALAAESTSVAARQGQSTEADEVVAMLDVGKNPASLTLKPDGGELFVSNQGSDSVSEVATKANDVGSTYPIGNRPAHGVVSADNAALWISNSGADSLSLYSIEDGRLLSSIHTGDAPDALAFSDDQHLLLAADSKSGDVAVIRTASKAPALFTMLPVGGGPVAIVVKAMQPKA
jgi:YVTN family beta-propeller protein